VVDKTVILKGLDSGTGQPVVDGMGGEYGVRMGYRRIW
jgi:hypothetical protein